MWDHEAAESTFPNNGVHVLLYMWWPQTQLSSWNSSMTSTSVFALQSNHVRTSAVRTHDDVIKNCMHECQSPNLNSANIYFWPLGGHFAKYNSCQIFRLHGNLLSNSSICCVQYFPHMSTASDKRWGRNVCVYVINEWLPTMATQSFYALSTQCAYYLQATSACCGLHCCFSHYMNRSHPQIVVSLK